MIRLEPLALHGRGAVDRLLDEAFGPDRRGRTAYAIRRGMAWLTDLSFAAVDEADGELVGLLQSWPVALWRDAGPDAPLVMIGPVAALPVRQLQGIGTLLMDRLIEAVEVQALHQPLMMIGDAPYYRRWGFSAEGTGDWRAPGPVDRARLLARVRAGTVLPGAGQLGPRRPG